MRLSLSLGLIALSFTACSRESNAPTNAASSTTSEASSSAATTTTTETTSTTTTPASSTASGACSMVGTWSGVYPPGPYPFSGKPVSVTFAADGTGTTASERAHDGITWKLDGGSFTLAGTTETGGRFVCHRGQAGTYRATFSADCASVTFKVTDEPCKGRAYAIDGNTFTKK